MSFIQFTITLNQSLLLPSLSQRQDSDDALVSPSFRAEPTASHFFKSMKWQISPYIERATALLQNSAELEYLLNASRFLKFRKPAQP